MKYLYVATVLSHICQFHLPYLKMLKEKGHTVDVAAYNNLSQKNGLALKYADGFFDIPFRRSPFDKQNIKAYKEIKQVISSGNYDVIVCNTPVGGVLTRLAGKDVRKTGTRIVYIVHGFHFYKGSKITNWILYYPLERLLANKADTIVTINKEDYDFAKSHFSVDVEHIHGIGVDSDRFHCMNKEACNELRVHEGFKQDDFIILCTGELNQNKNQKTLLKAASILKDEIPSLQILLAGNGPLENELRDTISQLGIENHVTMLGYRTDMEKIVPFADMIVSCSYREGMPLNIIEAMLCKKAVVASVNRGHKELIADGVNGYLFSPEDEKTLANRILQLYLKPAQLAEMGENGFQAVRPYTVNEVRKDMSRILWVDKD